MGLVTKTGKRRVIPRWRGLKVADATGELHISSKSNSLPLPFHSKHFIEEQIQSWLSNKNLPHAGDLLSSAFVLGLENEFEEVAKFILDSTVDKSSPLLKIAQKVLKVEEKIQNEPVDIEIIDAFDHTKFYGDINRYRSYLKREAKNPIAWIELGRLYAMVGLNEKAEKCVNNALYLDKNNRFIVRSASRFYHHHYPYDDKALQIVKRSEFVQNDPWLLSAEIAYSSVLERHSMLAKAGSEYVKKNSKDFLAITELTSALGTIELNKGKLKDAKKYFSTSLIEPNDNSIAQASWAVKELPGMNVEIDKYHIPLAFEAHAELAYNENNFKEAFNYGLQWLNDESFSSRPVIFTSRIAAVFFNDINKAIYILRKGLENNPDNPIINNNLVYYLAKGGQWQEAKLIFESKLKQHIEGDIEINPYIVIATAGLLFFRSGQPEEGRKYYNQAIELIKRKNNSYTLTLAYLNLIEEELRYLSKQEDLLTLLKQLETYGKKADESDVVVFYKKLKIQIESKLKMASK